MTTATPPGNTAEHAARLDEALRLAALGYPVFPTNTAKEPYEGTNGFKDASTDPDVIRRFWKRWPGSNPAVATAGLLIMDLDPGSPWIGDRDRQGALVASCGSISNTPRGGDHYWFRRPDGVAWRCSAGVVAPKTDVRTDGGYVLVPPGRTDDGEYKWSPVYGPLSVPADELSTPPDWLAKLLDRAARPAAPRGATTPGGEVIADGKRNSRLASIAGAMRRQGAAREAIEAALLAVNESQCDPPLPEVEVLKVARSVGRYDPQPDPAVTIRGVNGTPSPSRNGRAYDVGGVGAVGGVGHAAPASVPAYRPFPTHTLTPTARAYVEATATAMNCDPSYVALPVLAELGAAVGMSHVASPKKGWREPPFVWAVPVGKSGTVKSPPYRDVEDVAEDINDELEEEYERELIEYKRLAEEWEGRQEAGGDAGPKPKPPVKRAFLKGDVTIEALVGCLQDNPRGLLIGRDELSSWIMSFVKYAGKSGASDLPHWLQLSNAGTVNYTRKTGDRREVRVRGVGVSVTGTIQPGVLAKAMTEEFRQAGLLARLLLALPDRRKREWSEAEVDDTIRTAFAALVAGLHRLTPGKWDNGKPRPHLVKLTGPAKRRFVEFYNRNGDAMETADEDMAAAMSKIEGYSLRFALIAHCCRFMGHADVTPIGVEDMAAAIELAEWFIAETDRVYQLLAESAEQQQGRALLDVVTRLAARTAGRNGGGRVTVRDLQNHNVRKYPTRDHAEAALEALAGMGLGEWSEPAAPAGGGTPVRYFVLRPTPPTPADPDGGHVEVWESPTPGLHGVTSPDSGDARPANLNGCHANGSSEPAEAGDGSGVGGVGRRTRGQSAGRNGSAASAAGAAGVGRDGGGCRTTPGGRHAITGDEEIEETL